LRRSAAVSPRELPSCFPRRYIADDDEFQFSHLANPMRRLPSLK